MPTAHQIKNDAGSIAYRARNAKDLDELRRQVAKLAELLEQLAARVKS